MHKLCLYYGATVLTTHFTRSDAYQWCSGSVNHSPSSSSLITLFMCCTAFKQARVTPLLKIPTLNTSLIENYRPVSLLPFIAKTHFIRTLYFLFCSSLNKDTNPSLHFTSPAQPGTLHLFPWSAIFAVVSSCLFTTPAELLMVQRRLPRTRAGLWNVGA